MQRGLIERLQILSVCLRTVATGLGKGRDE